MSKLSNKVIWITGASSGIGEALAIELSRQNNQLILSARREKELNRVRSFCKNQQDVKTLRLDLADTDSHMEKTTAAIEKFGHIDLLINNGGISQRALIINSDLEVDRRVMEVNYFGTISLTRALLPHFVERKSGHVSVVTSAVGILTTKFRSGYSVSKHALHGFFDTLRIEHYTDNLDVTIICPSFIQTPITMHSLMGDGKPQMKMDEVTAKGMPAPTFAKKMIKALERKKEEAYIGGAKEVFAIYLKRFFPTIFSKIIRNAQVT